MDKQEKKSESYVRCGTILRKVNEVLNHGKPSSVTNSDESSGSGYDND